jgi:hypothetical protein
VTGPRTFDGSSGGHEHRPLKIDLADVAGRIPTAGLSTDGGITICIGYLIVLELEDDGSVWYREWPATSAWPRKTPVGQINPMLSSWKIAEEFQSIAERALDRS